MAINTQNIRIDLNPGRVIPVAHIHQNDTNRQLTFELYNNGAAFTPPSGSTVKFAYKSPIVNGNYSVITGSGMASGTISGNTVTVTLPSTYTQVSGVGILTMILTTSGNTLRPVNIKYVCHGSADGDDSVLGASDWPEGLYDYMDNWLAENEPTEIANLKSDLKDESDMLNTVLDIDYNKQYLRNSSWASGGYYSKSNGQVIVTPNENYKHYPVVTELPAGTYSFYNLARGYSIVQYVSDGSLHTFTELGATTTRGTLTISEPFNLYATEGANTVDGMFVNDISYPSSYVEGIYRYNSEEIGKINDLNFGFSANYQYLKSSEIVDGSYYNISNGSVTTTLNSGYRRWNPVTGLKAGTYSFTRLVTGYTVLEYDNGELHKLNEFGVVSAGGKLTIPHDFTLYATAGTNYEYTSNMFVNEDEIPSSYVSGIYKNGWNNVDHLVVSDPTTLYQNNTVQTIAHRGDFIAAPQCTKASYIIARKRGITIAENDLNVTADGEYVMYHGSTLSVLGNLVDLNGYLAYTDGTNFYFYDEVNSTLYNADYTTSSQSVSSLTRCVGSNYTLSNMPFSILRKLSFGAYKGEQFISQKIMTFAEWILLCKQLGMDAYIDRKITYDNSVLDDLFEIVQNYGMKDNVVWIGLTHEQGVYLRTKDANAKFAKMRELSDTTLLNEWKDMQGGRGVEIVYDGKTVTETAVHDALEAGYTVQIYYVDVTNLSKADIMTAIRTFVGYGVNFLSLDHYRVWEAYEDMLNEF